MLESNVSHEFIADQASEEGVCAVVTTFSPDDSFPDRIRGLSRQVREIVIVDDGASSKIFSSLEKWFQGSTGICILHHTTNRGVAAGLNTGLDWASQKGYTHAILLDDDSLVERDMVAQLMAIYVDNPNMRPMMVGANYNKISNASRQARSSGFRSVKTLITAGTLIPLSVFNYVGAFREDFFIDFVDHEYCLRARSLGVKILQCDGFGMEQPIGQRQKTVIGKLRSVHSPTRVYYFYRNSLVTIRQYISRYPGFSMWILLQQLKTLLKIILFLHPKRQYIRATSKGIAHGWRNRLGRIPEDMFR